MLTKEALALLHGTAQRFGFPASFIKERGAAPTMLIEAMFEADEPWARKFCAAFLTADEHGDDIRWRIRRIIAESDVPPDIQDMLADDSRAWVRGALVRGGCPSWIIHRFTKSEHLGYVFDRLEEFRKLRSAEHFREVV